MKQKKTIIKLSGLKGKLKHPYKTKYLEDKDSPVRDGAEDYYENNEMVARSPNIVHDQLITVKIDQNKTKSDK